MIRDLVIAGLAVLLLAYAVIMTRHLNFNWAARCKGLTLDTCDYVRDGARKPKERINE